MKKPVTKRDFKRCIGDAVAQRAIKPGEAAELIRRYEELVEQNAFEGGAVGAAARAKAQYEAELRFKAAEQKRRLALQTAAVDAIKVDLNTYESGFRKVKDVAQAAMNVIENYGFAGFGSVKGRIEALKAMATSSMDNFVWEFRRNALTGLRMNTAHLADVVRASFGENVSPQAQALYRGWLKQAEKLRQLFNAAGGNVGWLDGWGLPQVHDARAVLKAGFERWSAYIKDRLDWEKMKHPDGSAIATAERNEVLRYAWESITTDGDIRRKPTLSRGGKSLANSRQDARFFVFKDANSWIEYNKDFGSGDIYDTMMRHISHLAHDVGMMERLGPNPAATMEWLKQVVRQEAAKAKVGKPSLWRQPTKLLDKVTNSKLGIDARVVAVNRTLDGYYEQMRGGDPSSFMSLAGTTLRNFEYGAHLGGSVILHATTNPIIQSCVRDTAGIPGARMLPSMLRSIGGASRRDLMRAALTSDDILNSLSAGAREAGLLSKAAGASRILPEATTRWTGLKALLDNQKRAFQADLMGTMATYIERPFQELPGRLRRTMQGYGIDARDWRVMQMAEIHEPVTDARWLRWKEIRDVGTGDRAEELAGIYGLTGPEAKPGAHAAAIARETERTSLKYLEMIQQETERAAPSSTWRSRAFMLGRADPNTIWGQLKRSATMYHGFIASFMHTQFVAIAHEAGDFGMARGAAYVGSMMTALTLGGMLALQLKQLRSGKDLRSMDATTKEGRDTWVHAFLSSGSLGIYGDFLASDRNAYGHGPLETLAGPIAGMVADAFLATHAMAKGDYNLGRSVTNFVRYHAPLVSTAWPLQAAWNRVIADQLQFQIDPKAHKAMRDQEARVMKETKQGFWWKPGDPLPRRMPQGAQ